MSEPYTKSDGTVDFLIMLVGVCILCLMIQANIAKTRAEVVSLKTLIEQRLPATPTSED